MSRGLALVLLLTVLTYPATAQPLYWNIPASNPSPTGTWNTTLTNWNTAADGSGTQAAWTAGRPAVFAAGTGATGAYTVTLSAAQTASGLLVEEGAVSLAGSALGLGTGTLQIESGALFSIPSTTNLTASAGAIAQINGGTLQSTSNGVGSTFISSNFTIQLGTGGGIVSTANTGSNSAIYAGTITGVGQTLTKTGTGEFRYQGTGLPNTTFAKLVVNQGLYRLGSASSVADERGFGAEPATPTADAITLTNGGAIGTSFAVTLSVNRGITLGAGGGAFNNSSAAMTIPGSITGAGTLTKASTGSLILTGASDYTGSTLVSAGTLQLGSSTALGSVTGDTQVSGTGTVLYTGAANNYTVNEPFQISTTGTTLLLSVQNGANVTFGGAITVTGPAFIAPSGAGTMTVNGSVTASGNQNLTLQGGTISTGNGGTINGAINLGSGTLTKLEGGRWTLAGANTSTGPVNVNAGTLRVNAVAGTGSGAVTVAARLEGTGSITGATTVGTTGTLAPGFNSSGTLTVDSVDLAIGATLAFAVTNSSLPALTGPGSSTIGIAPNPSSNTFLDKSGGTLNGLSGAVWTVNLNNLTFFIDQPYSYVIGSGFGDQSGFTSTSVTFTNTSQAPVSASITGSASGQLFLNFTPTPEPSVLALVVIACLARSIRRSR